MLRILYRTLPIVFLCLGASSGLELPSRPSGPVADFANIISPQDEERLSLLAQALWEQAGFALVVATFPTIADEAIDDFANRLYEKWGIGAKGKDEGALLLVSLDPRKMRIEVGYGAEGYLNDAKCGRIRDVYGLPYFRKDQFSAGAVSVSAALAGEVEREKNISLRSSVQRSRGRRHAEPRKFSIVRLIFFVIAAAFLMGTPFGRAILFGMLLSGLLGGGRRGFGGGGFGGGFGGGGFGGGFGGGMSGGGGAGGSF